MNAAEAAKAAGVSKTTVLRWFAKCRAVCTSIEMSLPPLTGTLEEPIQVDESYFSRRHKNNHGRLRKVDKRPSTETVAREELEIELDGWGSAEPDHEGNEEEVVRQTHRTNYGSKVVDP